MGGRGSRPSVAESARVVLAKRQTPPTAGPPKSANAGVNDAATSSNSASRAVPADGLSPDILAEVSKWQVRAVPVQKIPDMTPRAVKTSSTGGKTTTTTPVSVTSTRLTLDKALEETFRSNKSDTAPKGRLTELQMHVLYRTIR